MSKGHTAVVNNTDIPDITELTDAATRDACTDRLNKDCAPWASSGQCLSCARTHEADLRVRELVSTPFAPWELSVFADFAPIQRDSLLFVVWIVYPVHVSNE